MNKYMGFFELKYLGIPTVNWQQFSEDTVLGNNLLWTLRVAVEGGNDLNLPRLVGVTADEAYQKGRQILNKYGRYGIVIYYPYFIAEKSGVVDVSNAGMVIEAVEKDLWNLVTHGRKNVTITISGDDCSYAGDRDFLNNDEIEQFRKYSATVRHKFRDLLNQGRSIIMEWSFAYDTDTNHKPIGQRYLVFYEIRSI